MLGAEVQLDVVGFVGERVGEIGEREFESEESRDEEKEKGSK